MARFLFIVPVSPLPMVGGGEQRTTLIHRALARMGDVDLFILQSEEQLGPETMRALRSKFNVVGTAGFPGHAEFGWWSAVRSIHPRLVDRMAHHGGRASTHYSGHSKLRARVAQLLAEKKYDAVIGRQMRTAAITGILDLNKPGDPPVVVDIDDLDFDVWKSRIDAPGVSGVKRMLVKHHYRSIKRIFPKLIKRCAMAWLAKDADVGRIGQGHLRVLRNIAYVKEGAATIDPVPPAPNSKIILTISAMINQHNRAGVDIFLAKVWPKIHAQVPEARFVIAGTGMTDEMKKAWGSTPGVEAIGFVSDLRETYAQCAFTVAPVWSGGGTNIKVLESLQYGRTSVLTKFAHRGYEQTLKDKESVLVAQEDGEVADLCVKLLRDTEQRRALELEGAKRVRENYSYASFAEEVEKTMQLVGVSQSPQT